MMKFSSKHTGLILCFEILILNVTLHFGKIHKQPVFLALTNHKCKCSFPKGELLLHNVNTSQEKPSLIHLPPSENWRTLTQKQPWCM